MDLNVKIIVNNKIMKKVNNLLKKTSWNKWTQKIQCTTYSIKNNPLS